MEGGHALDTAIDNIHQGIDRLLNEHLSLVSSRHTLEHLIRKIKNPKLSPSQKRTKKWRAKIIQPYSLEKTKEIQISGLFYSPNKWPVKEDYYNSLEWKALRKLVLAHFPNKKGLGGCSRCLKRIRVPYVHHVYGINRAVFVLMCKQCHEDHHYILKVTKRLEKRGRSQAAID